MKTADFGFLIDKITNKR